METLAPTGDINQLRGDLITSLTIQCSKPVPKGGKHYNRYRILPSQDPDTYWCHAGSGTFLKVIVMLPKMPWAFPLSGVYGKTHHDRCFSHTNQPKLPNLKYLNFTEYVLEEGQILLINFYLSLAHFLSLTHTLALKKCNKVSVNLRNLMFILISNKLLKRKTH